MELSLKNFFNLLFLPSDIVHIGGLYDNNLHRVENVLNSDLKNINNNKYLQGSQFLTINSLSEIDHRGRGIPGRADINVTNFRNFLFEIDNMPLEQQLELYQRCKLPIASITYSGGKSYHAIVSLVQPLIASPHTKEGILYYKAVWKSLAAYIANGQPIEFDSSCANPSRLSRLPTAMRDNGNVQELVSLRELMSNSVLELVLTNFPPEVAKISEKKEIQNPEDVEQLKSQLPPYLLEQLLYPTWVSSSGNYGTLYKLTAWAYDETGVSRELFLQFIEPVFRYMITAGYEVAKMEKAVHDFYNSRGL